MTKHETLTPAAEVAGVTLIPLDRLKKSPRNVRRVQHSQASLDALAASIAAVGVLQNLVVEPELADDGAPTGHYLVTAGEGRRLAQRLRVKRKEIRKTEPLPCRIEANGNAREISLHENANREAMLDHVAKLSCKSSRKVGGAYAGPPAALLQRAGAGRPGISTCTLFAAVYSGNPAAACTSVQSI